MMENIQIFSDSTYIFFVYLTEREADWSFVTVVRPVCISTLFSIDDLTILQETWYINIFSGLGLISEEWFPFLFE